MKSPPSKVFLRGSDVQNFLLPTEKQIVSSWVSDITKPVVSIVCHTYQHQDYVRDALNGFIAQRTNFPFEIIVHDDASTDGTREIIEEYAREYPLIIRTILQDENRFSKNERPTSFTFPVARGEYVALCEGDDYWTSEEKLTKQIAKLESVPDASGCFHCADDLDESTGELIAARWSPPFVAEEYTLNDLFEHGNCFPTASLVFRKERLGELSTLLSDVPHGDFSILAKLLTTGPLVYIDESMSVYRRHSGGIHSSVWGPVSTLRSLKSRINVAKKLELQDMQSYQNCIQKLFTKLESQIVNDREKIRLLEQEVSNLSANYYSARQSKFFRLGTAVNRLIRPSLWFN